MANFKLENVWAIMKKYNFFEENMVDKDMSCLLCNKLMINAHSAPCGCRYCFECISKYLGGQKNLCPGNMDYCKAEMIGLSENISIDHPMNIKISKIIVKCPEKSCEFKDEMRKIENHIRICNYRLTNCPYFNIGCKKSRVPYANMIDHLQLETYGHTKLLLDCIDNLNNEMSTLKAIIDKLEDENKNLKNEIREIKLYDRKQMEFQQLQTKFDDQVHEIDLLNQDMVALRNVDKCTRDDVDTLKLDGEIKQMTIMELQTEMKEESQGIEGLKEKLLQMDSKFSKLQPEIESIKRMNEEIVTLRNVDKCTREIMDKLKLDGERKQMVIIAALERKCEQQNEQILQFNKKFQQIENKFVNTNQERENKERDLMGNIKNVQNKLLEIEINQNKLRKREFVWKIDKFNVKMKDAKNGRNTVIYSDSFHFHKYGYKMCLVLYLDGVGDGKGTHLSLYFKLMQSDFDDILSWPFKNDVTFDLICQRTGKAHVSYTERFEDFPNDPGWNKPTAMNGWQGTDTLIKLSELINNQSLIQNNQLFIKCSVNIPL